MAGMPPFAPQDRVPSQAPDMTGMFNTPLNAGEQFNFKRWQVQNPGLGNPYDYDAQGFWKSGGMAAANGHGGDQFKKPNHPTFSNQSQYSGPDTGYYGGAWNQAGQQYTYTPTPQNLRMNPLPTLEQYFKVVEPQNLLLRPGVR